MLDLSFPPRCFGRLVDLLSGLVEAVRYLDSNGSITFE
jgi:hypothetical protein